MVSFCSLSYFSTAFQLGNRSGAIQNDGIILEATALPFSLALLVEGQRIIIFSKRPETKKTLQSYASTVGNVKILLIETNPLWGISYLDLNVRWHHRSWESHLLVSCLQIHSTGKRRLIKGSEVTKRLNQELQVLKAKRAQINQGNSWQRGIKFIWNSSITSMWKSKCWCDVWLYWDFLLNVRNGLNSKQAEPGISSDTGPEKVS